MSRTDGYSLRLLESGKDDAVISGILQRPYEAAAKESESVSIILADVEAKGDEALYDYTLKFDRADLRDKGIRVSEDEILKALERLPEDLKEAIGTAKANLEAFHAKQLKPAWFTTDAEGIILGHRYVPIERVGVYVPGGTAPLASTLLMCVVPALVAGVKEIALVTPPQQDGNISDYILAAAAICGITEMYRIGGPWSIGALAYGTASIPRVDKIVGPGNIYVSLAKKQVYGRVGIDGLYGPSEIVVVADDTADPEFVASDLLSQSEHDPTSAGILITPSGALALAVREEVEVQLEALSRESIARRSVESCGAIIVTQTLDEAMDLANDCAPEHLELVVDDPWSMLGKVRHAGAVFLGQYSTEPIGDYVAGTNHCLPTNGTARFSSGLGVDDFMRRHSVISYSSQGIRKFGPAGIRLAEEEGLTAHAASIRVRLEREGM